MRFSSTAALWPGQADPVSELLGVLHDVEAVDLGTPGARQQERGEDPDAGGLAGAVGPQQPSDGPGIDLEVDALQRFDLAEAPFELPRFG